METNHRSMIVYSSMLVSNILDRNNLVEHVASVDRIEDVREKIMIEGVNEHNIIITNFLLPKAMIEKIDIIKFKLSLTSLRNMFINHSYH